MHKADRRVPGQATHSGLVDWRHDVRIGRIATWMVFAHQWDPWVVAKARRQANACLPASWLLVWLVRILYKPLSRFRQLSALDA